MQLPMYVRKLTKKEKLVMQAGLRSKDAFVIRRSQIVLGSARSEKALDLANRLGCNAEAVRNVIKGFKQSGIAVVKEGSRRPHTTQAAFSSETVGHLKELLHHSPRNFGKASSVWTLGLAAEVSYENGLVAERISAATIRATLKRFGMKWTRAKHWITSPDPNTTEPFDKNGGSPARLGVFLSRSDLVEPFFPS